MTISVPNRDHFISSFLLPLSRVNDSCIIKVSRKGWTSLVSSVDGALILYCNLHVDTDMDELSLNIPDLGRLAKILSCIEEDSIDLNFTDNNINYESSEIRFKYHLLEDGIIMSPPIDINKLKSIDYNTAFRLTHDSLLNVIKASSFASDSDKIYFFTKDGKVYGELTDHQKHNSDSVTRCLSTQFSGDEITDSIPINFEMLRIIANNRADTIMVLVNTDLSVFTFEVSVGNIKNTYVVTGLVKN